MKETSDITGRARGDLTQSRRRKIRLCNAAETEAGRRGASRLSNYPLKPNLRCCLKLTYANEVAKSHGRPRRLGGSEIGLRVLSRRHRSSFPTWRVGYHLTVWCVSFMFKCRVKKTQQIAGSKAGGIKESSALMSAQRMIPLERFHGSNIIPKTTKFFRFVSHLISWFLLLLFWEC